jgi:hypothetical protein
VSGELHAPAALPTAKSPLYSLDRRLGGLQRTDTWALQIIQYNCAWSNICGVCFM